MAEFKNCRWLQWYFLCFWNVLIFGFWFWPILFCCCCRLKITYKSVIQNLKKGKSYSWNGMFELVCLFSDQNCYRVVKVICLTVLIFEEKYHKKHIYGYKRSGIVRNEILLSAEIPLQIRFSLSAAVLIEKRK